MTISSKQENKERLILELNEKKYIFSTSSLIIFAIGVPLIYLLIYYFLDAKVNVWVQEAVTKHSVFFLNTIFDANAEIVYTPERKYPWDITIGEDIFSIHPACTGQQVFAILGSLAILTPHSKYMKQNDDIIWRKTKWLVVSMILTHIINIVRITLQLYLASIGLPWEMIHQSVSDFTGIIAAMLFIIYLGYKWLPEFFISIYYAIVLISNKIAKAEAKAEAYPIKKRRFIIFLIIIVIIIVVLVTMILLGLI